MKPRILHWRLRVMMAERKIKTVTELGRRLQALGVTLSSQHLTRLIDDLPQRLNTELLAALLAVLDCRLTDLIQVEESEPLAPPPAQPATGPGATRPGQGMETPAAAAKPPRKRRPKPQAADVPVDDVIGPVVRPFPIKPRG